MKHIRRWQNGAFNSAKSLEHWIRVSRIFRFFSYKRKKFFASYATQRTFPVTCTKAPNAAKSKKIKIIQFHHFFCCFWHGVCVCSMAKDYFLERKDEEKWSSNWKDGVRHFTRCISFHWTNNDSVCVWLRKYTPQ